MRIRCLLIPVTALAMASAHADTMPLPDETVSSAERQRFRICRAAIIIELQEQERTVLPPATVRAMREQIEFIMAETIFSIPALNIEDGARRLDFTERFILDFGRTVGGEGERLRDPVERTEVLLDCQPMLWAVVKERIDILMQWRRRALDLERPFPVDNTAHSE